MKAPKRARDLTGLPLRVGENKNFRRQPDLRLDVVIGFSGGGLNTSLALSAYTPALSNGSAIRPLTTSF